MAAAAILDFIFQWFQEHWWFYFVRDIQISNFMKIHQLVQKLQHFLEFQDGDRRHLGFRFSVLLGAFYSLFSWEVFLFQILWKSVNGFKSYSPFTKSRFWLGFQHLGFFGWFLGVFTPWSSSDMVLSYKRHFLTPNHVFWAIERKNRSRRLGPTGEQE